jgi:hypothetical protein
MDRAAAVGRSAEDNARTHDSGTHRLSAPAFAGARGWSEPFAVGERARKAAFANIDALHETMVALRPGPATSRSR